MHHLGVVTSGLSSVTKNAPTPLYFQNHRDCVSSE